MTPEMLIAMAFADTAQPRFEVREQYHHSGVVTPEVRGFEEYMLQLNSSDMSITFGSDRQLGKGGTPRPWLLEVVDALIADVPHEEWDKIPEDFASTVEKKLYGKP